MDFLDSKKIHFIGIGGIGVSALAKLCHNNGIFITGSDLNESEITKSLEKDFDAKIKIGNNPDLITKNTDFVIYSPAISKNDLEYEKAISLNIPIISYPEAIGKISKQKNTIAISGTNGKTTTTTMLTEVLKDQNINPTVVVGGILRKYNSNFLSGDSKYFITEACEYKRSFLNIHHNIAVITNITEDHLDYFKNLSDIQSAFIEFIKNKKENGILICNTKLENLDLIVKYAEKQNIEIIDYSKYIKNEEVGNLFGEHNKQNMAATLAVLEALNLNIKKASEYLKNNFSGTKRRMEYIGKTEKGAIIFDDYAHNPEGIKFLLGGIKKKYPNKKIILLFEPHLYSRTEDFKEEFGQILSLSDILYLFPVYKAREEAQPEKDFILKNFIHKKENFFIIDKPNNFKEIFKSKKYNENYIVITVGAGNIWKKGLEIKY